MSVPGIVQRVGRERVLPSANSSGSAARSSASYSHTLSQYRTSHSARVGRERRVRGAAHRRTSDRLVQPSLVLYRPRPPAQQRMQGSEEGDTYEKDHPQSPLSPLLSRAVSTMIHLDRRRAK
eukprot:252530-Rhodomonas_salina.1